MSEGRLYSAERVESIRRAFDQAFAAPPPVGRSEEERLLGLGVGGDAFAIRLADIRGLVPAPGIVAVPGPEAALLGIAGLRGALLPIYGLAVLLGYPAPTEAPRWVVIVIVDDGVPVGLAFDRFEGYLQIERAALVAREGASGGADATIGTVQTSQGGRAVIDVGRLLPRAGAGSGAGPGGRQT
jgi:purine-binding chemotaxis protein CheW